MVIEAALSPVRDFRLSQSECRCQAGMVISTAGSPSVVPIKYRLRIENAESWFVALAASIRTDRDDFLSSRHPRSTDGLTVIAYRYRFLPLLACHGYVTC